MTEQTVIKNYSEFTKVISEQCIVNESNTEVANNKFSVLFREYGEDERVSIFANFQRMLIEVMLESKEEMDAKQLKPILFILYDSKMKFGQYFVSSSEIDNPWEVTIYFTAMFEVFSVYNRRAKEKKLYLCDGRVIDEE